MTRLVLALVLFVACFGCQPTPAPPKPEAEAPKPTKGLPGKYVGWMFVDGTFAILDGSTGMKDTLTINPDGTWQRQAETTIMQTSQVSSTGKYVRSGDELKLTGVSSAKVQIEAAPEIRTFPIEMHLDITGDTLRDRQKGAIAGMFYRKVGAGPPDVPEDMRLKPSDPKAVKLIEAVQETYASLKSFSCEGSLTVKGGGYLAPSAQYRLDFERPSKLRYVAKTPRHTEDLFWDGTRTWWNSGGKDVESKPLRNALGIIGVNKGPQGELLTSLLLPKQVTVGTFQSPEITLSGDETVDGKFCQVLVLRTANLDTTRIWIDKSSRMVLKLRDDLAGATVTFKPSQVDPSRFKKPAR